MGEFNIYKNSARKIHGVIKNLSTTVPRSECIAACIVHFEGLRVDFEREYNDRIKIDYPLWFVDLENYEPVNENVELVDMLLDLKDNVELRRAYKESVFAYISIKDSHQDILHM